MKKLTNKEDKSCVYRTLNFDKVTAPCKQSKNEPTSVKCVGTRDLRGGKK